VSYERRASPLHAARGAVGAAYCIALAVAALLFTHPLVLAALAIAVVGAAAGAHVRAVVLRTARFAVPFALVIAVINVLVRREGLTVIARLGEVPPFGQLDLTAEALAYGVFVGMRIVVIVGAFALFTIAVNPDELLRLMRRVSFRSALTAVLATRLVPVLARDSRRLADAQRCRPGGPPSRVAVLRAISSGALDRAVDVAATLEVRGYGTAGRLGRDPRPWSRHDLSFAAAAVALVAVSVGARLAGVASVATDTELHVPFGLAEAGVAVLLVAIALLPFADRRGIDR
jgi:energy-coupling factor transport system permease protein